MNFNDNRMIKHDRAEFLKKQMNQNFDAIIKSDNWDYLILITRKGYWVYKLMKDRQGDGEVVLRRHQRILSDRYITKCLNMEQFENKKVWIFDDTMTTGTNLFFFYSYLRKHKADVTPIVFGLSTEYSKEGSRILLRKEFERVCRDENWSNEVFENKAMECIEAFNNSLIYKLRMSAEDIAIICTEEVQYFNDCLCPMVIDLPILSCAKRKDGTVTIPAYMNEGTGEGITMQFKQFEQLKKNEAEWKFHETRIHQDTLEVNCSYFRYMNHIFLNHQFQAIHDCIVKCKYRIEGDKVRLVFAPFAIFKSLTFDDMLLCFFEIFQGTEYGNYIHKYITEKIRVVDKKIDTEKITDIPEVKALLRSNHNLCRNMFRSIIFYVSDAIGNSFKKYVYHLTGIEMEYDWNIMYDSFSESFRNAFYSMSGSSEIEERLHFLTDVKEVSPIDLNLSEEGQKIKASEEEVEMFVLKRLIEKRRETDGKIRNRVYSIESIKAELEQFFQFTSEDEKKCFMTQSIIVLLETSRFGNEIYIDNEDECIYRGFRYGENSELLFMKGMECVCIFVIVFYYLIFAKKSKDNNYAKTYNDYYSYFMNQLEAYCYNNDYFTLLINHRVFEFLKQYFGSIPEEKLEEQIMNKRYVFENCKDPDEKKILLNFADEAFKIVPQWMV